LGHANVLLSDVETLGNDPVSDALIDNDSDGVGSHIENAASLSVVKLVGHTLLDSTIGDHINVISLFVTHKQLVKWRNTVLSERFAEQVSSACAKSETVGHLSLKPSKYLI